MKFSKYQHVERYGKEETEGLNVGECFIFSKIDGTNGSVWNDDGVIRAGSRNRELSLENDNAGFYSYICDNTPITQFLIDHPDYRLYGEFLVPHAVKSYYEDAWRKFYVFDVMKTVDGAEEYIPYFDYIKPLTDYQIPFIPLIREISNPTEEMLEKLLPDADFLLPPDATGEGIVIKNYDYVNPFGRITWGKVINSEFSATKKNRSKRVKAEKNEQEVEKKIIDEYITEAFVLKEKAKITEYHGNWENRFLPELFGRTWHELLTEEAFHMVKEYKNPVIDFSILYQLMLGKIKRTIL